MSLHAGRWSGAGLLRLKERGEKFRCSLIILSKLCQELLQGLILAKSAVFLPAFLTLHDTRV